MIAARRRARLGAAATMSAGLLLLGGGCSDLDRALDVLFPPRIAGLPAGGGGWLSLPIGSWVTEGGTEADAIAACFARACDRPAAVAAYRVTGADVAPLDATLAHPDRLAALLSRPRPARRGRKPAPPVLTQATEIDEGVYRGIEIRMSRRDGSRPVVGLLVARQVGEDRDAVLVIAADDATARPLLRSVLAARS